MNKKIIPVGKNAANGKLSASLRQVFMFELYIITMYYVCQCCVQRNNLMIFKNFTCKVIQRLCIIRHFV